MAVLSTEVAGSYFLPLLLLFLPLLLLFLCSDCTRRSFKLQEPQEAERNPAGLVRVVRLEETAGAVENPAIADIQRDEENPAPPWRSHLGKPGQHSDLQNSSGAAVTSTPESNSAHDIYQVITEGRRWEEPGGHREGGAK